MPSETREFFVSGGTLTLDSESYIERQADHDLFESLKAGRYCYVLNSRQMGKSSLSVRMIARLNDSGVRTAFIDLTQIGQNVQAAQWYAGMTGEIGRAFGLYRPVLEYFKNNSEQNPMQRFFGAIRDVILVENRGPIVIFIDEIDGTLNLPFDTDEFFAGIRECFNRRVQDENCRRLTFCLIGVAVPNDLIRNPTMTPFNIGERIRLQDFNLEELQRFGVALGSNGDRLTRRVHYWTNGQPFLTQNLCREIASDTRIQEEKNVDALVRQMYFGPNAVETNLHLADVTNRVLWHPVLTGNPDDQRADLLSAYEKVWKGGSVSDDEANRVSVILKLSGLLRSHGGRLIGRNRIYHHVFDRTWIHAHMPGQELLRQRRSFQKGVLRGIAFAAGICSVIGVLGFVTFRARQEASAAKDALSQEAISAKSAIDYELYVSEINSLRLLEASGDSARMAAVLERSRTNSHRDFEWNFWLARLHDSQEEYTLDYTTPGKYETGVVSQDGSQICIIDELAKVVAVVDRHTKRVLGTAILNGHIIATTAGLRMVEITPGQTKILDIATRKVLCSIGTPGFAVKNNIFCEQSNEVVLLETSLKYPKKQVFTTWNLLTGRCIAKREFPPDFYPTRDDLLVPAVSKDANRFAYRKPFQKGAIPADVQDGLVIWDTRLNREVDKIPLDAASEVLAMSESGRYLVRRDKNHVLRIRDIDQKKDIYSLDTGIDVTNCVSIAPDDQSMICVTSNGLATIRELPSGRLLSVRNNLRSIAFTSQKSVWVGCSSSVRILNISSVDDRLGGIPQRVAVDGEGALRLTTQGATSMARFGDPSLKPLAPILLPVGAKTPTYNRLWCLTPGPNRTGLVTSIDGTSPPIPIFFGPKNLACGNRSDVFAVLRNTGQWYGFSGITGKVIWTMPSKPDYPGMWMSWDSTHLIAATAEGYVISIDPLSGKELRKSRAHHFSLSSLSFSRDGKRFLTGGRDGLTVLWDTNTLEKLTEFRGNAAQSITGATISPDGNRVGTCNDAGNCQIWDSKTGEELTEIHVSNFVLRSIAFTADGQTLVTAGDDGIFRTWGGIGQDPTVKIPVPVGSANNVTFK